MVSMLKPTEHTPGDREYLGHGEIRSDATGVQMAYVLQVPAGAREANARLIAAAPRHLLVSRTVIEWFEEGRLNGLFCSPCSPDRMLTDALRAMNPKALMAEHVEACPVPYAMEAVRMTQGRQG